MKMKIGVLALQGAFIEHRKMLSLLNTESFEIRQKKDIEIPFDGLILPGGESTVIGKLLRELGLFEPLREKILGGFPVFGTCAGLLLLAKTIENDSRSHFAAMDITAMGFKTAGSLSPTMGTGECASTMTLSPIWA